MAALARRLPGAILFAYTVFFFVFVMAPILIVVVVSFNGASYVAFPLQGLSFQWYERLWEYAPFLESFIVSIEVAILSSVAAMLLAVPAALVLARSKSRFAAALMSFLLSPLSMPSIVFGFGLLFYVANIGLGISLLSLVIGHTVVSIPYVTRTVAGLYRTTSPNLEDAACVLGADRLRVFWHVTLPVIRPAIFAGALFALLISLDNIPVSYFLSSPSTNTLPIVLMSYLENQFDPSVAAASSVQLLIAVMALLIVERVYGLRTMTPPT